MADNFTTSQLSISSPKLEVLRSLGRCKFQSYPSSRQWRKERKGNRIGFETSHEKSSFYLLFGCGVLPFFFFFFVIYLKNRIGLQIFYRFVSAQKMKNKQMCPYLRGRDHLAKIVCVLISKEYSEFWNPENSQFLFGFRFSNMDINQEFFLWEIPLIRQALRVLQ